MRNRIKAVLLGGAIAVWTLMAWAQDTAGEGSASSAEPPASEPAPPAGEAGAESADATDAETEAADASVLDDFFVPTEEVLPAQEITFPVDI